MNRNIRKRVTISFSTNEKLKKHFRNNYEIGQFLTYLIEQVVNKLPDKTVTKLEIEIVIEDFKIK